ncbi:MAG: tetratricopeptide repeat protein [Cytophagales bacterium]|nr:tetratricopeptide repeat protein [Cytophagales bacterium]MDW8384271.1 hypothetical protein [Flammeovirgaceae bacterium]
MMKWLWVSLGWIGLQFCFADDGKNIGKINQIKQRAQKAYQNQDYRTASMLYQALIDQFKVEDAQVRLNLAHAYFHLGKQEEATRYYESVAQSDDKSLASIAYQQLGVLESNTNVERALLHCKNALKMNPSNQEARYNYELLKRKISQQNQQHNDKNQDKDQQNNQQGKQSQQQQQNQSQQNQNQQNQSNPKQDSSESQKSEHQKEKEEKDQLNQQGKESKEEKEKKEKEREMMQRQQRLQNINMTEEKARLILDALKNNEIQYYQQMMRKPSQKIDKSKPDW